MISKDIKTGADRIERALIQKVRAADSFDERCDFLKKKLLKYRFRKPDWISFVDKRFSWISGQYALGLVTSGTEEAIRALTRYYDFLLLVKQLGFPVFEVPDQALHAEVLLIMYERYHKKRYRPLIREAAGFLKAVSEQNDGFVVYWPPDKEILVDSLGMISDFAYHFEYVFGDPTPAAAVERQLRFTEEACIDLQSGLPFHAYDHSKGTHRGSSTWGRGTGWYLLGLTAWALRRHEHADRLLQVFRKVFAFQDQEGFLYDDLAHPVHIDTSPTCMAALCLAKCIDQELFDPETTRTLIPHLSKSIHALVLSVTDSGQVMNCSGECRAPGAYSDSYGNYFAQGYTLMLFRLIEQSERLQRLLRTCEGVDA